MFCVSFGKAVCSSFLKFVTIVYYRECMPVVSAVAVLSVPNIINVALNK